MPFKDKAKRNAYQRQYKRDRVEELKRLRLIAAEKTGQETKQ